MLFALIEIVGYLAWIVSAFVIVQFIVGLLFAFNVVSTRNEFLMAVFNSINLVLDPILNPIRRILPNTGAIDFSPLVLIVLLRILMILLSGLAMDLARAGAY